MPPVGQIAPDKRRSSKRSIAVEKPTCRYRSPVAIWTTLAELRGWTQFVGLQIEYSLVERTVERELILMAKALNLGALAFSPLAKGVLTGKYHGEGKPDGGRMTNEGMKEFLPEEQRAAPIISAVKSLSEQTGRSMAQVALA